MDTKTIAALFVGALIIILLIAFVLLLVRARQWRQKHQEWQEAEDTNVSELKISQWASLDVPELKKPSKHGELQ